MTTLVQYMLDRVELYRSAPLFYTLEKDGKSWHSCSWEDFEKSVKQTAAALVALGIEPDQAVAMFTYNCPEFFFLDFGSQYIGVKNTPIYMSNTASQAGYILKHIDVALVLVDSPDRLEKVLEVASDLPHLRYIVTTYNGPTEVDSLEVLPWSAFLDRATPEGEREREERFSQVQPGDVYTVIYTSGTTGDPKGVMLTHRNTTYVLDGSQAARPSDPGWRQLSYLPLAHVAQRIGDYNSMAYGASIYFAPSIDDLVEMFPLVRPHIFVAVPRVLEKVYDRVMGAVEGMAPRRQKIFHSAERLARKYHRHRIYGESFSLFDRLKYKLFERLVYRKIKGRLGGEVRLILSGGALLPSHIGEFFYGIGVPILVVYGLTETSAPVTYMVEDTCRYDTVATVFPGTEMKVADDGEVLFRGANLFAGYFRNEEATKAVIDDDGWFHTGDLGEIDDDGYLRLRGRKKELIVTSQGQNIAPAPIENQLKSCPVISQAVVVGDDEKYLCALFTISEMDAQPWTEKEGLEYTDLAGLIDHPRVREVIQARVDEVNQSLASYQTIKKWKVLPRDLSQEEGELTPTLKVKRPAVHQHFAGEIEALYRES